MITDYHMMIEHKAQLKVAERRLRDARFRRDALAAKSSRKGFNLNWFQKMFQQTHLPKILPARFFVLQNSRRWASREARKV